ncbi:hypothetical protein BHE74_00027000 [Ensete ventricosum]|nr:hypothetical protein BHE74_00027000 [Ensete ventricosum]
MERTSSIELEPRTLTYAELQHARGVKPVPCIRDKTYINRGDNDDDDDEDDDVDDDDDEMMDYLAMEQTYRPSF